MSVRAEDLLLSRFRWGVRYKDTMQGLPFALFVTESDAKEFLDQISHPRAHVFETVEIDHTVREA